jgi:hypothetical protein
MVTLKDERDTIEAFVQTGQVRDPYFFFHFSFKSKLNNNSKIISLIKDDWGIK